MKWTLKATRGQNLGSGNSRTDVQGCKFMRRSRSAKRGSERSASKYGITSAESTRWTYQSLLNFIFLVPPEATLQIILICLRIRSIAFRHSLLVFARQPHAERSRHFFREVSLQRKDVGSLATVLIAPDVTVIASVNQLGADLQIISALHDSAFEHGANTELSADCLRVRILPL